MVFTLYKYRVSADGGHTWTVQWLTEAEAQEEIDLYGHLCERADNWSFKKIYA